MAPRSSVRWKRSRPRRSRTACAHDVLPRVPEKTEQSHGVQLLAGIGGKVYVMGTRRSRGKPCPKCGTFVPEGQSTRQTSGVPDVMAFLPPRPVGGIVRPIFLFWEAKAGDGTESDAQLVFKALCQDALVEHVVGDYNALIAWLIARLYVKAESFPHYRQPNGGA